MYTHLQGVMNNTSRCGLSWMMTRLSLEMAMKASSWVLVEQSSTTTAQDSAPRRLASGENRGRTLNFFLEANRAETKMGVKNFIKVSMSLFELS